MIGAGPSAAWPRYPLVLEPAWGPQSPRPALREVKMGRVLRLDPRDNALVALEGLRRGETASWDGEAYTLASDVAGKHKFATTALGVGDPVYMYGVMVGRARRPIARGEAIGSENLTHDAAEFTTARHPHSYKAPDVSRWRGRRFMGYRRRDGRVGTRNVWIVVPLVFCENRNVGELQRAFEEELGYAAPPRWRREVARLVQQHRGGGGNGAEGAGVETRPVFEHVDGVRFLTHTAGCGSTREDSDNLCGLIAGYLTHPNVAGGTVLSLGCQHSQIPILMEKIRERDPGFNKPLVMVNQQTAGTEARLMERAIGETFAGLVEADRARREPAELAALTVGLKCGGSDGFSGISANPAIGHTADLLAALGGIGILSEFPELCGAEQELIDRCVDPATAERFAELMRAYAERSRAVGSGFELNPSPGNIRDGLITGAMKSAGAARKGGRSPVTAVLDYPEPARTPGLNLQCTPGNDVECVTAQAGAGANLVLFTTGLGTPTGNPIAPVVKLSTNTALAERMPDIIDIDTGSVVRGEATIEQMGEEILERAIAIASGERVKAERLGQNDFIPWKRGVSL